MSLRNKIIAGFCIVISTLSSKVSAGYFLMHTHIMTGAVRLLGKENAG